MIGVSTHDHDLYIIVDGMGGNVTLIINPDEVKSSFEIQRFMMDQHRDITNFVKGVVRLDKPSSAAVNTTENTTWHEAIDLYSVCYYVDSSFKMVTGGGVVVDANSVDENGGEECPPNSKVVSVEENPLATLVPTSPLFFVVRNYVKINF